MPNARYFLSDSILTALYALSDRDCQTLFAAFDQIAESPREMADSIGEDWDGRIVCIAHFGRFDIGYVIGREAGLVTITLLRPSRR